MGRESFRTIGSRHRHVHAKPCSIHREVQTFAIQESNRRTGIRNRSAHLHDLLRKGASCLICTEQEVLFHRLPQNSGILKRIDIVVGNALLRRKFKRQRIGSGNASKRKRANQLNKSFFGIVTGKAVQDFGPIYQANTDTVFRPCCCRLDVARLQAKRRAAGFFLVDFDEVRTGRTARFKNFSCNRRIHSTPRRSSSYAPEYRRQAFPF